MTLSIALEVIISAYSRDMFINLRKYYYSNRIITNCNSLPNIVVNAKSVIISEKRLDHFCNNQACYFDYKSELTGTGSLSQL